MCAAGLRPRRVSLRLSVISKHRSAPLCLGAAPLRRRHGVVAAPPKGVTAQDPPRRQHRSAQDPVHPQRLRGVLAARRRKPAAIAQKRADELLVEANRKDQHFGRPSPHSANCVAHGHPYTCGPSQSPPPGWHAHAAVCVGMRGAVAQTCPANNVLGMPPACCQSVTLSPAANLCGRRRHGPGESPRAQAPAGCGRTRQTCRPFPAAQGRCRSPWKTPPAPAGTPPSGAA